MLADVVSTFSKKLVKNPSNLSVVELQQAISGVEVLPSSCEFLHKKEMKQRRSVVYEAVQNSL